MLIRIEEQGCSCENLEFWSQPHNRVRFAVNGKSGSFGRSLVGVAGSKTAGDIYLSLL